MCSLNIYITFGVKNVCIKRILKKNTVYYNNNSNINNIHKNNVIKIQFIVLCGKTKGKIK